MDNVARLYPGITVSPIALVVHLPPLTAERREAILVRSGLALGLVRARSTPKGFRYYTVD